MDDKKIGEFISNLRTKMNISQTKLAEDLHISRTTVNKWESGKISITSNNLKLLSEYFSVSTDEILMGEFFTETSKSKFDNFKFKLIDQNQKLKNNLKIAICLFIIFFLSFLVYYFFSWFGKTNVYIITNDNDDLIIKNGFIFKTPDKLYFTLEYKSDNSIDNIKLCIKNNNEKKEIFNSTQINNNINIIDFYELQEYFKFSDFKKIINNLYLEVKYTDEEEFVEYKLNVEKDYINNKMFFSKRNSVIENTSKYSVSDNFSNYYQFYKNLKNETIKLTINKKNYEVFFLDELISIKYDQSELTYFTKYDNIVKLVNNKKVYDYSIKDKTCNTGNCDEAQTDIMLIDNIFNKLK